MAVVGIRKWLNDQGYKDPEITYDHGTVKLQNRAFMNATPQADGSTYADTNALGQAFNRYRADAALGQAQQGIAKPYTPFKAPTQADLQNDPSYQAALRDIQARSQTAQNNAMVALGRRGIGNSSSAVVAANQIQQQGQQQLQNDVIPQLVAQRYQAYLDEQKANQTGIDNNLKLYDTYDKQYQNGVTEQRQNMLDQQALRDKHIQEAADLSKIYGVTVEPKNDYQLMINQVKGLTPLDQQKTQTDQLWKIATETGRLPNELADAYGLPHGMSTLEAQRVGISQQNADTSSKNADTSAGELAWRTSDKNPANQPKSSSSSASNGVDGKTSINNYSYYKSQIQNKHGLTKDQAKAYANANAANMTDADYRALIKWIDDNL